MFFNVSEIGFVNWMGLFRNDFFGICSLDLSKGKFSVPKFQYVKLS